MDISKSISYRGLEINSAALQTGRVLRGIAVENVDYSEVDATSYSEKRAASDGMHVSDVYLGGRSVDLSGFIYTTSLAEMFDFLHVLRAIFSPTSAYQDSPGDRGFLPMHFTQPTLDTTSFPGGIQPLFMYLRPMRGPRFAINRDRQDQSGTHHNQRPVATQWSASLIARDPRVYVDPAQSHAVDTDLTNIWVSGQAVNRGDYESPLNIMLVTGSTPPPVGAVFKVKGLNNIDMTIKMLPTANIIYRWMGSDRVLMTEDIEGGVGSKPLILRMDLVEFATLNRRPMVPADILPASRPYSTEVLWLKTGNFLLPGSRLFWNEAFA